MSGVEVYETEPRVGDVDPHPEWRFRVKAPNGKIVAQSEGYVDKAGAEKGVRALRRALLPNSRSDRELNARAWQRGYLFAYYQDHDGRPQAEADVKSRLRPTAELQQQMDELNPYKQLAGD